MVSTVGSHASPQSLPGNPLVSANERRRGSGWQLGQVATQDWAIDEQPWRLVIGSASDEDTWWLDPQDARWNGVGHLHVHLGLHWFRFEPGNEATARLWAPDGRLWMWVAQRWVPATSETGRISGQRGW